MSAGAATGTAAIGAPANSLSLVSPAGDFLGLPESVVLTQGADATSSTQFVRANGSLELDVLQQTANGSEVHWATLYASMPWGQAWRTGTFPTTNSGDATHADLEVSLDHRSCNTSSGTMTVNAVHTMLNGVVDSVDLSFSQTCTNATSSLTGHLLYSQPEPLYSYNSDQGSLTSGNSTVYAADNSTMTATYDGRSMHVTVTSQYDSWTIDMTPPRGADFLSGTSYPTEGSSRNNVGTLKASYRGFTCSNPTGHLTIASVAISGSVVTNLNAGFDLSCSNYTGAVHGALEINS
jgi:hypothetical protein